MLWVAVCQSTAASQFAPVGLGVKSGLTSPQWLSCPPTSISIATQVWATFVAPSRLCRLSWPPLLSSCCSVIPRCKCHCILSPPDSHAHLPTPHSFSSAEVRQKPLQQLPLFSGDLIITSCGCQLAGKPAPFSSPLTPAPGAVSVLEQASAPPWGLCHCVSPGHHHSPGPLLSHRHAQGHCAVRLTSPVLMGFLIAFIFRCLHVDDRLCDPPPLYIYRLFI